MRLTDQQRTALDILARGVENATESGLFDLMQPDAPTADTINEFCDMVAEFAMDASDDGATEGPQHASDINQSASYRDQMTDAGRGRLLP